MEAKIETDEKEKLEAAEKARDEKIETFLTEATEAGKMLPSQKDMYVNQLVSAEDIDAEMDKMTAMFEELPQIFNIGGKAKPESKKELSEDGKGRVKLETDMLARDLKNLHLKAPEEKEAMEFSVSFASRKDGDKKYGMEQAREREAKEIKGYIS